MKRWLLAVLMALLVAMPAAAQKRIALTFDDAPRARGPFLTPEERTARIIQRLPHAESLRLPDCGHLGMIERHSEFNAVLDRLLERVRHGLASRPPR